MVIFTAFIVEGIHIITILSFYELLKKGFKYLRSHRHKWINLGTDQANWESHLRSNTEGIWSNKLMDLLAIYTEGRYCLTCGTYSFFKKDIEGNVISQLNFHQSWARFAKEVST